MTSDPRDFFSIDSDAHLRQAAAAQERVPASYPAELVRLALQRGATLVEVECRSNRLEIRDNGAAVSPDTLRDLHTVSDSRADWRAREEALVRLRGETGWGWLALFASRPGRVTVRSGLGHTLTLSRGRHGVHGQETSFAGNRIELFRRGDVKTEIALLREYCFLQPARVRINGRPPTAEPQLPGMLVQTTAGGDEEARAVLVGIPARGDCCRLRLLCNGVVWRIYTRPPVQGLVFEAAASGTPEQVESLWRRSADTARELYRHLGRRFPALPPAAAARVEELFFLFFDLVGEVDPLPCLAAFVTAGGERFTLTELRGLAARGEVLHARPFPGRGGADGRGLPGELLLSRRQLDFLVNAAGVPLVLLPPAPPHGRLGRWRRMAGRMALGLGRALLPKRPRPVPLSPEMAFFLAELQRYWQRPGGEFAAGELEIVAVHRRVLPGGWRRRGEAWQLQVAVNRSWVRQAAGVLRENFSALVWLAELFAPLPTAFRDRR